MLKKEGGCTKPGCKKAKIYEIIKDMENHIEWETTVGPREMMIYTAMLREVMDSIDWDKA